MDESEFLVSHRLGLPESSRRGHPGRRAFDMLVAGMALVTLSPLLAVAALAIVLDSRGSALFRQERLGQGMTPFTVLKFRTMSNGVSSEMHERYVRGLIQGSSERQPAGGLYKLVVDDRVTRVGRVLRKSSIDELPQLWNVLRGEMSLVGPRPVIPYEAEVYPPSYARRFAVKPGLTGLWQVSGRNERTYEEMVRLDIDYVERQSFRLDVSILLKTVLVVLGRKGAA